MANAKPMLIPIILDKARNVLLDFNALSTAEELTGRNFLDPFTWSSMGARDVRALLFGGLQHEDNKLQLTQVGAMLHGGNIEGISDTLAAAYKAAMPEPKQAAAGEGDSDPLPTTTASETSSTS